jgi:thioredoxin-related protein
MMPQIFRWSLFTVLFLLVFTGFSQEKVQWLTFKEAIAKQSVDRRKIIVDIYTKWCKWCKEMDNSTFNQNEIAQYINQNFHAVKFDAEQQEPILFNEKTYQYVKYGKTGYHELAVELTRGRLSYPTLVFLDENMEIIQAIRGFQTVPRLEQIITYFAQDKHKTTPWAKYTETYKPSIHFAKQN